MNKRETHIMQGMTRDLSVSRFNPNLVVDARNIRITPLRENSTLLSVTNEKGTSEFKISTYPEGTIIGTAVIKNHLILFTTQDGMDRIYNIRFTEPDYTYGTVGLIYGGSLGFDVKHPLETLAVYENENIQKVYWVDGINQPRVVNIANGAVTNGDIFNFNRKIAGGYSMQITKYNTGGEFPTGTIQYCFNYFNKFGQETNLVDVSPLYYLCPEDKGLPADAMSTSSFVINLSGLDGNYEYVRLYSIVRTSENATPNVRIVGDYKIQSTQSLYNIQDMFPGGYLGSPIQVPTNKLYILDISNGTKTLVSSKYPNIGDSPYTIPLLTSEYLFSEVNNRVFFVYTRNAGRISSDIKANYIPVYKIGDNYCLGNDDDEWESAEIGSKVNNITVSDNGIIGSTLDATALIFIGGQDIIAGTLTSKDNTLFLGNIKQNTPSIGTIKSGNKSLKSYAREFQPTACIFNYQGSVINNYGITSTDSEYVSGEGFYDYPIDNNRSSYQIKTFKARENYRLGFIAQYNTGQWSEAVWIDDIDETFAPGRNVFAYDNLNELKWGPSYRNPGFKVTIPTDAVTALKAAGFIRVAPVVVYPSSTERKVQYQGILASTVFNVADRGSNSPFAQADWSFRSGYNWNWISSEIQCNPMLSAPFYPAAIKEGSDVGKDEFVNNFYTQYYRDPSILTFHSPDIEDENIYAESLKDLKLRIVGISNIGFDGLGKAHASKDARFSFLTRKTDSILPTSSSILNYPTDINDWDVYKFSPLSYGGYIDLGISTITENGNITGSGRLFKYCTYLWHRNGPLGNSDPFLEWELNSENAAYGALDKKCISELRYARTTFFQNTNSAEPFDAEIEIETPKLVSEDSNITVFKNSEDTSLLYYNHIDKVLAVNRKNLSGYRDAFGYTDALSLDMTKGYPIEVVNYTDEVPIQSEDDISAISADWVGNDFYSYYLKDIDPDYKDRAIYGGEPVSIKYKSTKHIVIPLKGNNSTDIYQIGDILAHSYTCPSNIPFFWAKNTSFAVHNALSGKLSDTLGGFSGLINDSVLVAELYREFTPEAIANRFGGQSDTAISNNVWTRCGESVELGSGAVTIYFREGDTYIGRYDCLKTYPYTNEDQNQIVSIYSTELESRVNLDARYDKNRGLVNNTPIRPTNFNLFNHPGYEQSNQYFTYKALDYSRYPDSFPNMLTWSLEKKMGADIDAWTSIPMTSTGDAQGELGEITNLETFNDNVYLFQPRGVAQVLFNSRVQIPTSDGQPIEITNGLKYGGLRYLSNQIGLTNKWSLATTPHGMYFIDDEKNILYQFNGQQFSDMSTKFGFSTWLTANNSYAVWNPQDYGNFRTFYDKVREDLYFVNKYESLVFSEKLNTFVSFYDYDALPALINMNDRLITFRKNSANHLNMAWELFTGEFNHFFGTFKPYWLTFISNSDPTYDKVFNNLAWRSTDYTDVTSDFQGELAPLSTFDTLRVWNDHQDTGEVALTDTPGKPSPIKKKFNVFRALIPRDKEGDYTGKGMNRIRNPWTYIQLMRKQENSDMLIFHDLDVDYFI